MSTHNYSDLFDENDAEMLQDMDETITKLNLWDWMKTFEPEEGKGFMFSDHPNLELIRENSSYGGHSGSSYGWTMRMMQCIAQMGWEDFRYERLAAKQFKKTVEYIHLRDLMRECRANSKGEKYFEDLIDEKIKNLAKQLKLEEKPVYLPSCGNTCPCYKAKGLIGWCGVAGGGVPACQH